MQIISGLGVELQPGTFRGGGENSAIYKLLGSGRFSSITLKRGVVDQHFFRRVCQTPANRLIHCDVSIVLRNEKRSRVCQWRLSRAWPVRVNGPDLNTNGDEVAIETLELGFETIELTEGGGLNPAR